MEEEEEEIRTEDEPNAEQHPDRATTDIYAGLPPVSSRTRTLLFNSILIGSTRDRLGDAPYADWMSLLGAFVLDEKHEDTQLMRWCAQRGIVEPFFVLTDFRGRRRIAREAIRTGTLPPPVKDGWFTNSVHSVLQLALTLSGTGEVAPDHIVAAMILPAQNAHAQDLERITREQRQLTELRWLTAIYSVEFLSIYEQSKLFNLDINLFAQITRDETETLRIFNETCSVLGGRESPLGAFRTPYAALVYLVRAGHCDHHPRLKAFVEGECQTWNMDLQLLDRVYASGRDRAQFGEAASVVAERARRIFQAVSPDDNIDIRHIVAALYAASEILPPRAKYIRTPEQVETLEALLTAVQATSDDIADEGPRHATNAAWADIILGPAKRVPVVRDSSNADLIDFDRYARAFAALIVDREVIPPLALGVFGAWGSGKSTFMRLIEAHVRSLSERALRHGTEAFYQNLIQIRFNAWHYNDVNLLASIVSHIFDELDAWLTARAGNDAATQMLDRLNTARDLTLDATTSYVARRREQLTAKKLLDQAERDLKTAQNSVRLGLGDMTAVIKQVFAKDLDETGAVAATAAKALGLDHLQDQPEQLIAAVHSLSAQIERGKGLSQALLLRLGGGIPLALFVGALVIFPVGLAAMKEWIGYVTGWAWVRDVSTSLLAVSGFLTTAAAVITRVSAKITPALDQLSMIKDRLDRAVEKKRAELGGSNKDAEATLVAADAALDRARTAFDAANKRLAEEFAEFATSSGAQRLRRLVRDRAANGTYARHLGLIATIQKDFEQLAELLKPAATLAANDSRRIAYERSVRSIVREAGLDDEKQGLPPRSESLTKLLADTPLPQIGAERLISDGEAKSILESTRSLRDAGTATGVSVDRIVLYIDDLDRCGAKVVMSVLEAIHIFLAFDLFIVVVGVDMKWLLSSIEISHQQISDGDALDFLEKIFQIPFWVPGMTPAMRDEVIRQALPGGLRNTFSQEITQARTPPPGALASQGAPNGLEWLAEPAGVLPAPLPKLEALSLDRDETTAVVEAGQIAGDTPRRLKRLARSYLLLRASLPNEEARQLGATVDACRAIAFLLAAASGAPRQWPALCRAIDQAKDEQSLAELLSNIGFDIDEKSTLPSISICRNWINDVGRFTFVPVQMGGVPMALHRMHSGSNGTG